jgi:excinuclease ABC subunit B
MPEDKVQGGAVAAIRARSWTARVIELRNEGKVLEAQRLLARTKYDLEMIQEVGYCSADRELQPAPRRPPAGGRAVHADRLLPGRLPAGHRRVALTLPQIKAMYNGDTQRKTGAGRPRVPAAQRDGQPAAEVREFHEMVNQCVYVSATPGKIELEQTGGEVVEQVIRPTG